MSYTCTFEKSNFCILKKKVKKSFSYIRSSHESNLKYIYDINFMSIQFLKAVPLFFVTLYKEIGIHLKALSIARRFIVAKLLLLVHQITVPPPPPMSRTYTSFKLVNEKVSWVYAHICMGYCEFNIWDYIHHGRSCHEVMRKYSAYTEAEMLYSCIYICYLHTEIGLAPFSTNSTLI